MKSGKKFTFVLNSFKQGSCDQRRTKAVYRIAASLQVLAVRVNTVTVDD